MRERFSRGVLPGARLSTVLLGDSAAELRVTGPLHRWRHPQVFETILMRAGVIVSAAERRRRVGAQNRCLPRGGQS